MSQMGFFDIANRYAGLDAKIDPLVKTEVQGILPSPGIKCRSAYPSAS